MMHWAAYLIAVAELGAAFEVSVAPEGRDNASGTIHDPLSLTGVCAQPLRPGTTVLLSGGTYHITPDIVPELGWRGTRAEPVVMRSAPGEWAIIDGRIEVRGASYVVLRDFEMTRAEDPNTLDPEWWNRPPRERASYSGADANLKFAMDGRLIDLYNCEFIELINLYLHDNVSGGGIGAWNAAVNTMIYGCLIIRNGWDDKVRGHGHGCYIQNGWPAESYGGSLKVLRHNINALNMATGVHAYSVKGDITNVHLEGNVFGGNGLPSWTNGSANFMVGTRKTFVSDIVARGNHFYQPDSATGNFPSSVCLGWATGRKGSCFFEDNYVFGGGSRAVLVQRWEKLRFTGNTLYDDTTYAALWEPMGDWTWDRNTYYENQQTDPFSLHYRPRVDDVSFQQWRTTTGFDGNSGTVSSRPNGTQTFIFPNAYDSGRANVLVYNWERRESVELDLSSLLRSGDHFTVYNALDYLGVPVAQGVFSDESISVEMRRDEFLGSEFQALVLLVRPK